MKPLAAETFGLEGAQVYSGKCEESAVRQMMAASEEERVRVVHMFNDLPAGYSRSLFRFQGCENFLVQPFTKTFFCLSSWRGLWFESADLQTEAGGFFQKQAVSASHVVNLSIYPI